MLKLLKEEAIVRVALLLPALIGIFLLGSTIVEAETDHFDGSFLDSNWTVYGNNVSVGEGALSFFLPGGIIENAHSDNSVPRVMQAAANTDLVLEAGFIGDMTVSTQMRGIVVEDTSGNHLIFNLLYNGSHTHSAAYNPIASLIPVYTLWQNYGSDPSNLAYLKVTRVGDVWTSYVSPDGENWILGGTTTRSFFVSRVGVFAGNGAGGPRHIVDVDYFKKSSQKISTLPEVSSIPSQVINVDSSTGEIAFTVSDPKMEASSLLLYAISTNEVLIPDSGIEFGGSGSNRTVTITPASGEVGVAAIEVIVDDGSDTATSSFEVSVVGGGNSVPIISVISDQTIDIDASTGAIPFTVTDQESGANGVKLFASSSNKNLIPESGIVFGGSGENRTVAVMPTPGELGFAIIDVYASDGSNEAVSSFSVTVASPVAVGTPSASTTGTTGKLTDYSGIKESNYDGEIIENLNIVGGLRIKHNNVIVRNCKILGTSYFSIIDSHPGATSLTIEACELTGSSSSTVQNSFTYTIIGSYIHSVNGDALKLSNHSSAIGNYITDVGTVSGKHADGIQVEAGSNILIQGNHVDLPYGDPDFINSHCIIVQDDLGTVDSVIIDGNWLTGGGYSLQLRDKSTTAGAPTNCSITNNVFGGQSQFGDYKIDSWVNVIFQTNLVSY